MPSLTLAYITSRIDPKIEWFFDSLFLQDPFREVKVIVVDRCKHVPGRPWPPIQFPYIHVTPKPSVWQGEHRLTKADWFAASNARNTALCFCDTDHIAYVDDLSVLTPGWLDRVKKSISENYIAFGAYKKVWNLKVDRGQILSFDERPGGVDSRFNEIRGDLESVAGSWLYGCSLTGPTEAFLEVNGWPEFVDSLSSEDSLMGIAIGNTNKYSFRYDKRMLTLESAEAHEVEPSLRRTDKGVSPNDKSHAALNIALQSKWFPNYFGEGGIRGLRERTLKGEPFPPVGIPDRDWYDGQLISEML